MVKTEGSLKKKSIVLPVTDILILERGSKIDKNVTSRHSRRDSGKHSLLSSQPEQFSFFFKDLYWAGGLLAPAPPVTTLSGQSEHWNICWHLARWKTQEGRGFKSDSADFSVVDNLSDPESAQTIDTGSIQFKCVLTRWQEDPYRGQAMFQNEIAKDMSRVSAASENWLLGCA